MSQPNPQQPQQPYQPKKSKKAAAQEALISPPWFPDAMWHLKTLAAIYAVLIVAYFGISRALSGLSKPYRLRRIPMEMTPWLHPGGKVHLPEEKLVVPPDDEPSAPRR
ncbi:MAG: hypothetical protein HY403_10200 [Elusimicrobia bacterium]|nr:hypothetical protein [Elusimicrobiota bacterium]